MTASRYRASIGGFEREVLEGTITTGEIRLTLYADDFDFCKSGSTPLAEVYDCDEGNLYVFPAYDVGISGAMGGAIQITYSSQGWPIDVFKDGSPRALNAGLRERIS